MTLGSRFIHFSWLSILCVGGIHLTQVWRLSDRATGHLPQTRAIETITSSRGMTFVDDALSHSVVALGESSRGLTHWSELIPDQGRPSGRLRGGSSR